MISSRVRLRDRAYLGDTSPVRSQMAPLLFLVGIFFLNFISRIVLSPLLPSVEKDLRIGHEEAGAFFFIISFGYCIMLLGSSFVSSRLSHRKTIILSTLGLVSESWMIILIFLQPMLASSFFPPGFAALSRIGGARFKSIAISLTVPVSFLLGGGAIPAMIGAMGQVKSFSTGFIILGGMLLGGTLLCGYLNFARLPLPVSSPEVVP